MNQLSGRHNNPVTAILSGITDMWHQTSTLPALQAHERLDGKTCLVTGANSGLGKAVAIALAGRGARVIMACRSGIPQAGEDVKQASGKHQVAMYYVDLANLESIRFLGKQLKNDNIQIDVAVLNAGLMPKTPAVSKQGYEMMYAVHYLANRMLIDELLKNNVFAENHTTPRIICVSSEAHRSAKPVDFTRLGQPVKYTLTDAMGWYGQSKLILNTYAAELARRLTGSNGTPETAIFCICPGPVNSNIARDVPWVFRPLLKWIMSAFFRSPESAAKPIIYLACAQDMEGQTGLYFHMSNEKKPDAFALDPENRRRVWEIGKKQLLG